MYYKFLFLMVVGAAVILVYFIYAAVIQKESAFTAYLFDAHTNLEQTAVEEEFTSFAGIDTEEYAVTVDASFLLAGPSAGNYRMTSLAKFYTEIGTEELDVCLMLEENFMAYADSNAFLDLRTCLSEEQIGQFKGKFIYVDDVPVGIKGNHMKWIRDSESYEGDACVFGILFNSGHVENAVKFLGFLNEA